MTPTTYADPLANPHNAVPEVAHARLCRQAYAVLDAFRDAPGNTLTNDQLARVAIRYSARIYTLRRAGYVISIVDRDDESGVFTYRLANPSHRHAVASPA